MNRNHDYTGDHWFHVAECFTAFHQRWRFELAALGNGTTDVYLQIFSRSFASELSPMTRLFMAAGLANEHVRRVHFV
ncbi:unnamed protein product, partial [Phaeothamnion confervicola]